MILQHHERLDGSGYPRGLHGDEVILEARIIAVADTYEAMAHDRPYRGAPGTARAVEVLQEGRGLRYDDAVVGALLEVICAACQAPNPPGNRFCHQCGGVLGPGAAAGERGQLAERPGRRPPVLLAVPVPGRAGLD